MIELSIDNSTQYTTAYRDGLPVATLQRGRVYSNQPEWQAFALDGSLLCVWKYNPPVPHMVKRLERFLAIHAAEG